MKNVLRTIEETEGGGLADTVKKLFLLPDPLARYLKLTVYYARTTTLCGGTVASWLVHSPSDQAVWVRALVEGIVLCSWVSHFTLIVPLSTQVCKWVLVNLMLGITLRWTSIPSRGE